MKLRQLPGKQHGYVDNQKNGLDERFELVRRPYSDYRDQYQPPMRQPFRHRDDQQDFDRYDQSNHWVSLKTSSCDFN